MLTKIEALNRFRRYWDEGLMFESLYGPTAKQSFLAAKNTDPVAVRSAWNDFSDMLCKDGEITAEQYETWSNPF